MVAVSTVRGRPLVITRSNSIPRSIDAAAYAWSRPATVSGTSSGFNGRPWSKYETAPCRIT